MKKRRFGILMFLLAALFTVTVGYAALFDAFTISGKVTPSINNDNLDVKFQAEDQITTSVTSQNTAAVVEVRELAKTTCVVLFTGLSSIGETATVTLPIINASENAVGTELDANLPAKPTVLGVPTEDPHFSVVAEWQDQTDLVLEAARAGVVAGTNAVVITIELLVTPTTDSDFHTFTVEFTATTA